MTEPRKEILLSTELDGLAYGDTSAWSPVVELATSEHLRRLDLTVAEQSGDRYAGAMIVVESGLDGFVALDFPIGFPLDAKPNARQVMRFDPMVPIPRFQVRVVNRTGQALAPGSRLEAWIGEVVAL